MAAAKSKTNPMACTTAGTEFILTIALSATGGFFLGRWLDWPILAAVAGGILGFAVGLCRLIRTALGFQEDYAEQIRARKQQQIDSICED